MNLNGYNVCVVGMGKSGRACVRFCHEKGAMAAVTDQRPAKHFGDIIPIFEQMGIRMEFGAHNEGFIMDADLIVLSPGVSHTLAPVQNAVRKGIPVIGEVELAARFIDKPIVAVTGTNGKTTVTTLTGQMLTASGVKVFVGGNIGRPLLEMAKNPADYDWAVVEVSSFQLDTIDTFHPVVSVLLNISQDHMDRYPKPEDYANSKSRIFINQGGEDTAVFNKDDKTVAGFVEKSEVGIKLPFGGAREDGDASGVGARVGDKGVRISFPGKPSFVLDVDQKYLPGRHNRENVAAAGLAALAAGGNIAGIRRALVDFTGLPHRLAHVAVIDGVSYVNDSKGTNPDATKRALEAFDEPIVLIMGGLDEGNDFSPLLPVIREKVKLVVLMGRVRDLLASLLDGQVPAIRVSNMKEAVCRAGKKATSGDVVLLSPACASFDMYDSYAARGEDFSHLVRRSAKGNQTV